VKSANKQRVKQVFYKLHPFLDIEICFVTCPTLFNSPYLEYMFYIYVINIKIHSE